jgi:enoyl-[acyl-carrier protein] reductase II
MASRLRTRITKVLGIEHPLILPGMSWISTPPLVAAVSNAGGLGILATGPLSPEQTRESIREIRRLAPGKQFGIGCTLLMPGAKENAEVALEEKVPVINFSLGKADWLVKRCHEYGGKVIATVVNEKHAKSAEEIGADALMATGHEAAAHGGDITSLVLVPALSRKTKLPIICAGGIGDGSGLAAMLCLGADGVAMGSRFATTVESPLAEAIKLEIVRRTEADTIYGKNFDGLYARVMKTEEAERAMARPLNPVTAAYKSFAAAKMIKMPLWKVVPGLLTQWNKMYQLSLFGAATEKLMKATIEGDLKGGVQFVGQSMGLINDIPRVQELVDRVIQEAKERIDASRDKFRAEEAAEKVA